MKIQEGTTIIIGSMGQNTGQFVVAKIQQNQKFPFTSYSLKRTDRQSGVRTLSLNEVSLHTVASQIINL